MTQTSTCKFTLALDDEERSELLHLLELSLKETRVEEHRTRTLGYREAIEHRRVILEGLTRKVRQLPPAGG
jgi:hypothetical protein